MAADPEQRDAARVPVCLRVRYGSGDELGRDLVENLSGGGLFIRTHRPLPIGTALTMELVVARGPEPAADEERVVVRGRVIWDRVMGDRYAGQAGMGVQFTEELPGTLRRLLGR